MHTSWENAQVGQIVDVSLETDANSKMVDPYCCRIRVKNAEQRWVTVGHIPREISRFVFYFIREEGGTVNGRLLSTRYRPSPIPAGGLEVPLELNFSCMRFITIEKMRSFVGQYNYDDEMVLIEEENDDEEQSVSNAESQATDGSQNTVELEMDDGGNEEDQISDSDNEFDHFFGNRSEDEGESVAEDESVRDDYQTSSDEDDELDQTSSDEEEPLSKKKTLKRLRCISSDDEE